ncbi:MAG: hypothetical protein P1U75_06140 [Antarcticimicrobium sp.]|uniref:hypothetical protein n=1 Tax=Antarcticimicrobium sp. TaxID=2824147 RepID=UPI00262DB3F6|nr:hypothetical protein [Antarcticimicrobium sp.]MDF1716237.1 hypothetical protein [Antarcticimicrobium sp.]
MSKVRAERALLSFTTSGSADAGRGVFFTGFAMDQTRSFFMYIIPVFPFRRKY